MALKASHRPMVRSIPVTKARAMLGKLVNGVNRNKDYVVIEKSGLPVAVLMDIDEFEDYLEAKDPGVQKIIADGTREYSEGKARPAGEFFAELDEEERGRAAAKR